MPWSCCSSCAPLDQQLTTLKTAASDPLSMHHFPTLAAVMGRRAQPEDAQQAALRAAWPTEGVAAAKPDTGSLKTNEQTVVVGVGLEYQCGATGARRMVACNKALALAGQRADQGPCVPLTLSAGAKPRCVH